MESYEVNSLSRTLKLLELLSRNPEGMTLTAISAETELNKSTVFRLLAALINHGYVIKNKSSSVYDLSLKLFELGSRAVNGYGCLAAVRPLLRALAEETKESVHFVLRELDSVVYLCKEETEQGAIHMASRVGLRNPMYCTGVGKAILANIPEEERNTILENTVCQRFTSHTILTTEELRQELALTRQRGYAVDQEEHEIGVCCVAAPILNGDGAAYAAISVSVPAFRFGKEKIEQIVPELINVAKNAEAVLRGRM